MDCVESCLNEALKIAGRFFTMDELMKTLTRDQGFWGDQGGVTFTGGEPLLQHEFLFEALRQCRSRYMHTAVETSAHVDTIILKEILQWLDWLFIDITHMDPIAHRQQTGLDNSLILRNIEELAFSGWKGRLIIRVPVIPGYNDTGENLSYTAEYMKQHGLKEVNLLPFHRLGTSKYEQLGVTYKYSKVEPPSRMAMLANQRIFEDAGLDCYIDYETPF